MHYLLLTSIHYPDKIRKSSPQAALRKLVPHLEVAGVAGRYQQFRIPCIPWSVTTICNFFSFIILHAVLCFTVGAYEDD